MDFLTFLIAFDELRGVDIPAADSKQLATLDSIYGYLQDKLAQAGARPPL